MALAIQRKDLGLARIKKELAALATMRLTLGVQGAEARERHPNANASVGQVAAWSHYGTPNMRKRPYADVAIANLTRDVPKASKKMVADLIDGRTATALEAMTDLGKMGARYVKDAIETANRWVDWDLSPATISRKGHDRHLVDTGTVRDASSYSVRQGDRVIDHGKAPA